MFKYKYIVFNTDENSWKKENVDNYFNLCISDLKQCKDVEVVCRPGYHLNIFLRFLMNLHNSKKLSSVLRLPFKKMWFPFYFKSKEKNRPYCFITMNHNLSNEYYKYLKKKYKDCVLICFHRDSVNLFANDRTKSHFSFNPLFDYEISYDPIEAKEYNLIYLPEFESKITIEKSNKYPLFDVFLACKAKDRLPIIISVGKRLRELGLTFYFYITGVEKENRIAMDGVVYSDDQMSYKEMLFYSVNSRCILEVNYGQMVGYTSRFLESIIYEKKLITNNKEVTKDRFYKKTQILYFSKVGDITKEFVLSDFDPVQYDGSFSPMRTIESIEKIIR